ncbi:MULTISPECIES: excinuclease [unclassified Acinetobacter]|uniref:excinuclease n=1 Tax=unclassified Acinetobacter TaxID=196816 RepID=UPI00293460F1|nr:MULTISPECIES: excinuclease [unclassified Acinetobacter]WOE31262.1 excinuclease [Acinetobacter sp. SAAs470]WOE39458.1 excinuclease [Acinetobacter sp. SAAs474]
MSIKKMAFVAVLSVLGMSTSYAADKMYNYNFNDAVNRAIADGVLDGSVKFYLAGTQSGGKLIEAGVVTNKKTNGFAKSAEGSCDHVLRSALIQLQNAAQQKGANAVTNIVSFYKSNETKSTTSYQCAKGTLMTGVALKGNLVKL